MIKTKLWNKVMDDLKRISTALKMLTEELDRFFIDVNELKNKRKRGD